MKPLKARVRKGRLVLDEPTDLPEGQEVELIPVDDALARGGDHLDDEERAALHRSIEEGIEDFERGDVMDAFELAGLRRESPVFARFCASSHERVDLDLRNKNANGLADDPDEPSAFFVSLFGERTMDSG